MTTRMTETQRSQLLGVAELFQQEGKFHCCLAIYSALGAQEQLLALGDLHVRSDLRKALAAYKAAGARQRITDLGVELLQQGYVDNALAALIAAEATDVLLAVGIDDANSKDSLAFLAAASAEEKLLDALKNKWIRQQIPAATS